MRRLSLLLVAFAAAPLAAQSHVANAAPASRPAAPAPHAGAHWSYEGEEGPRAWGRIDPAWRICSIGHEQSPIDLGGAVAAHRSRIEEQFAPSPFVLFHNGHTVQAALEKPSTLSAEGGRFEAVQFHFHHPSEHTVQGRAFPAELHLVHRNAKGELAVLGIFIAFGPRDNPEFEALLAKLPKAAGDSVRFTQAVDIAKLIEDHAGESEAVFTYHGSLTTPPCSEGVKWTVRERPIRASFQQLQRLVAVLGESARPVQPIFDRH